MKTVPTLPEHYRMHLDITQHKVGSIGHTTICEVNNERQRAWQKPGTMVRICAGYYLIRIKDEIIELDHLIDEGIHEWIAREVNREWYSDPQPTRRELLISLGNN